MQVSPWVFHSLVYGIAENLGVTRLQKHAKDCFWAVGQLLWDDHTKLFTSSLLKIPNIYNDSHAIRSGFGKTFSKADRAMVDKNVKASQRNKALIMPLYKAVMDEKLVQVLRGERWDDDDDDDCSTSSANELLGLLPETQVKRCFVRDGIL